jgi:hypothetical protein
MASISTKPASLVGIYLRGALGFLTKKRSLGPEVTHLKLPEETLDLTINQKHVRDFIRVVDNSSNKESMKTANVDAVPITYLQCLLNGMPMNLMTHKHFPLNIVGSVHESITIDSRRPVFPDEKLSARCHMVPEIGRSNKDDWLFTVVTDVMNHSDRNDKIMSMSNQYRVLNPQRHQVKIDPIELPATPNYFEDSNWELINSWTFPGNTGRCYAALNGDINPIHMHPIAGMVFGYKSCIAHGMYSVCALLQEPPFAEKSVAGSCTVAARFIRPLLLPAKEVLSFQNKNTNEYVIGTRNGDDELKETIKGSISFST